MGSEGINSRKPRFLCLHGFRTSGEIMKKQVTSKWHQSVLDKLDLVYVDAPFPSQGKSEVEGIFDPPYYEWFQFNKEFTEYQNFDKCLAYVEDFMIKHGPFDGLLGFSQGAILSAGLPGLQEKGVALTKVPKIRFLIIIGGAKFKNQSVAEKAYASPIQCRSVHFLGENDFLNPYGIELIESCVDPLVIHHPKGHTVPRFDDKSLEDMHSFLDRLQKEVWLQMLDFIEACSENLMNDRILPVGIYATEAQLGLQSDELFMTEEMLKNDPGAEKYRSPLGCFKYFMATIRFLFKRWDQSAQFSELCSKLQVQLGK